MEKKIDKIIAAFADRPFFALADILLLPSFEKMSDSAMCNLLNEEMAKKDSRIEKIVFGIYCVKKEIPGTGVFYSTSPQDYLSAKYLGGPENSQGYVSGLAFLNAIGYTDDVPGVIEIVSNLERSRGRLVSFSSERAYLRKPLSKVTLQNSKILPAFDVLCRGPYKGDAELLKDIGRYFSEMGITPGQVQDVFDQLPPGAKRRINIRGLLNEIAG
jgi:hypothetical protein